MAVRVALLKEEYAHFLADSDRLNRQLECLTQLKGHDTIARWKEMAAAGEWDTLVSELLVSHYDPAYTRSLGRNYPAAADGPSLQLRSPDEGQIQALAKEAIGLAA